jgi:signal transduction histidine kinase
MNTLSQLSSELLSGIAWLAAWSSFYLPTIQLATFVACAAIALVILLLRREILVEERWALYFGWAFAVFAAQYFVQMIANFYLGWGYAPRSLTRTSLEAVKHIAHTAGSVSNNLLFLASARTLMGHRKLPRWAWIFAAAAAAAAFIDDEFWKRLPDMMFSAACLSILGWAMYVNFRSARRHRFAWLNVVGGSLYAAAHLFYAFSPIIVIQGWASPLIDAIRHKQYGLHTLRPATLLPSPLNGLDSLVFGVAFLLKILLFVGALLLIMKCLLVLAPEEAKTALGPVIDGTKEYLRQDTLLKALGESVEADLAVLCYRLPGADKKEVAWWRWLRDPSNKVVNEPLKSPDIKPEPPPDSWSVGKVLTTGKEQSSPNIGKDLKSGGIVYYPFAKGMQAFVTTPVKYQGAVIGALNVEWRRDRSYTSTAKLRLKQLAAHIAPTVHGRRQLIAQDQISKELRDCERLKGGLCPDNIERVLLAIQRNLNPIASGFYLEAGFERMAVAMDRSLTLEQLSNAGSLSAYAQSFLSYAQKTSKTALLLRAQLLVGKRRIGRFFLAVERERDSIAQPTLGRDHILRPSVAATLTGTLLVAARNHFEETLRGLQTSFDDCGAAMTTDAWCRSVGEACRDAGIREAIAIFANGDRRLLLGSEEFEGYVYANAESLGGSAAASTPGIPSPNTLPGGGRLLPLKIRGASAVLWLRVEQDRFGWERTEASPWKYFIDELAQIADGGLARIEQERLRLETTRLVLIGYVAGLTFHEVKHRAGDIENATHLVEMEVQTNNLNLEAVRDSVAMVKERSDALNSVATKLLQPLALNSQPAMLKDIVDEVMRFEPKLISKVHLETEIPSDHISSIPGVVIALAVSSVLTNAIEVLDKRPVKGISLHAERRCDDILLHITDTGPGVPPEMRPLLFTLKETAKATGHGVGLPIAYAALRESRGDLYLDPDSRDGWNRFTIQLPRLTKENEA